MLRQRTARGLWLIEVLVTSASVTLLPPELVAEVAENKLLDGSRSAPRGPLHGH